MGVADKDPSPGRSEWGCTQIVVPVMAVALAVLGWRIGAGWGWGGSILGSVAGVLLAVPATGVLYLLILGVAFLAERVARVRR